MIGGTARGIELRAPKGGGTRPTTGRLREALFAMLESAGASFDEVLDLYAGSGALGIEALSRGQGHATFVETDRRAAGLIRENLDRVRLASRGTVVAGRVGRWRPSEDARYTLVLADPPYENGSSVRVREASRPPYHGGSATTDVSPSIWRDIDATVQGHLADGAMVVVEHNARSEAPVVLAGLPLWRDRRHGAGAVAIYREGASGVDDALTEAGEPDDTDGERDDQ